MAIFGLTVALRIQSSRLASVKAEYATFQMQVKAAGDIAEAKARAKEKTDLANKEKVDAENKKTVAALRAESERLRNSRTSVSFLPPNPTGTPSTNVTADRAKLEAALRAFDTDVAQLVDRGDQAIADLNSAKDWAREQGRVK